MAGKNSHKNLFITQFIIVWFGIFGFNMDTKNIVSKPRCIDYIEKKDHKKTMVIFLYNVKILVWEYIVDISKNSWMSDKQFKSWS